MAHTTVDIADLARWPAETVHQCHSAIVGAIRTSLRMHAPRLIQASIASVQPHQPVNTGDYKRAWKVKNIVDGAMFFNPTVQAGVIDDGRRPGYGVSREGQEALARWAHLHGMDRFDSNLGLRRRVKGRDAQAAQARAVAFLIARAIKARGLPAKNVLRSAQPKITEMVIADVNAAIEKELHAGG
jgi:hypothetical protein